MKNKIMPFSNGTEFMAWRDVNCETCVKDCPKDDSGNFLDPLCDIETALALASVTDGMVCEDIAKRANLPWYEGAFRCSELVKA